MTALGTYRIRLLLSQTNCPACGADIVDRWRGGIAFATSSFACGAVFTICNDEIVPTTPCPRSSMVAARSLNQEAAEEAVKAGAA